LKILSSSVSQSFRNTFHNTYNIIPYDFYVYLKTSFGPLSNQNEDMSVAMHAIMTMNMLHTETFTSFMTRFDSKANYLKLKKGAKRGLLTATLANTNGKIQLLPDRLVKELRRVWEVDMSYSEMLVWLTQQDINQMNDGLKLIKVKRIVTDCDKDEEKKTLDKGRDQGKITDPNGLELIPKLLCYNCLNYGHGARDCKAPYCNQCDAVRPDHKSNDCPNPKKKLGRRRSKITPMPKKTKDAVKPAMKFKRKRGLKAITTSSYQTDEDEEDSLRQEAESEWDNDDSVEELEVEECMSDRKRSQRIRTIKYNNERSYIRKTSRRSGIDNLALHDSGAQAHVTRSTK